jgi:hypothetical protein
MFKNSGTKSRMINVMINEDYQMMNGRIKTIYNPDSPFVYDGRKDRTETTETTTTTTSTSTATTASASTEITIENEIDTVFINDDGKIVVLDTAGNATTHEIPKDENGENRPVTITDGAGNSYTVEDGEVKESGNDSVVPTETISTDSITVEAPIIAGLSRDGDIVVIHSITESFKPGEERVTINYTSKDTLGLNNVKMEILKIFEEDTTDVIAFFGLTKGEKIDFEDARDDIKGWNGEDIEGEVVSPGNYQIRITATVDEDFKNGFEDYETVEGTGCSSNFCCTVCGRDLTITKVRLMDIFQSSTLASGNAGSQYANLFNTALQTGNFNTCDRQAKLFAQIGHESANFNSKVEGQDATGNEIEWSLDLLLTYFKRTSGAKRHWFNQDFWDDEGYKEFITVNYYETANVNGTHKSESTEDFYVFGMEPIKPNTM